MSRLLFIQKTNQPLLFLLLLIISSLYPNKSIPSTKIQLTTNCVAWRYLWLIPPTFFFADNAIDRLSTLPPSTTGSLSSITTTSVASSEPDHLHQQHVGANGRGGGSPIGGGGGEVDDDILAEKLAHKNAMLLKQEKWWQTTIQVSIPFFLAGIGTIGAGVILGRVEVNK